MLSEKTKHGGARRGVRNSTYSAWRAMKSRCYNEDNISFHNYGGRGVTVCDRWLNDFGAFLADMGERPGREWSLDRIDPNGNYEPGNCRWLTWPDQCNNKRTSHIVEFNGRAMTVAQMAREIGLPENIVRSRIRMGWSHDRIASTPPRTYRDKSRR